MRKVLLLTVVAMIGCVVCVGMAEEQKSKPQKRRAADSDDEQAIHKTAESYVAAFNKGDATAVAAHWTQDGDYIDETGRHLKGRDAIAETFEQYLATNKGLKLQIIITSLRFPAENLAVEDGTTVVIPVGKAPSRTARYTAVRVKQGGQWKLASIREAVAFVPSHSKELQQLDWLIGDWEDEGEHGDVLKTSSAWSMNDNFIVRSFSSTLNSNHFGSGVQWIGWDPVKKRIRSWSFDSSGGFGQGIWTGSGNKWVIESTSVLPDGSTVTETGTVTRVDPDSLTWQATNRKVGDEPMPDSKKIQILRQK